MILNYWDHIKGNASTSSERYSIFFWHCSATVTRKDLIYVTHKLPPQQSVPLYAKISLCVLFL